MVLLLELAICTACLFCFGHAEELSLEGQSSQEEEPMQEEETSPEEEASPDEVSFVEMQNLPSLQRMSEEDTAQYVTPLQVMQKIQFLELTEDDFLYPQKKLAELDEGFAPIADRTWEEEVFSGTDSEELNAFLQQHPGKRIVVASEEIAVGSSIVVPDATWLCGQDTKLTGGGAFAAFRLDAPQHVGISGFCIDGGFDYGVYVMDGMDVTVSDCRFINLSRKPVVFVGECSDIAVLNNRAEGNENGGFYFNGDIERVLVEGNHIVDNRGTSNWMAGIVLTAIDVFSDRDIYAPFGKVLHFPREQQLVTMLKAPHDVVLRDNYVADNNSSGIYCDGPYRVYIVDNRIVGNDKEGMCLDYGTIGAYVAENDILGNGNRARQSDDDLRMDFVIEHGRMDDGSAKAKLPGISIDNAAYNIVYDNRISQNYGSGVKMVRTGIRNIVSTNLIIENNAGENDICHFFGVEIGNAMADIEAINLDFTAGFENIICRNIITGKHYAGIFIDTECFINDFFDNIIMDAENWSIECLSDRFNSCVGNLSTVVSRGIPLSSAVAVPVAGWVE